MRLVSLLGVFMKIVAIKGKFFLSNASTKWSEVQCNLAEPELDFSSFELKENSDVPAIDSDVWIGYISAKIPFLLLGCAELQSGQIFEVPEDRPGLCYNLCNGGIFGIMRIDTNHLKCRCGSDPVHTMLQQCTNTLCTECYAMYMQHEMTQTVQINIMPYRDCLIYLSSTFYWTECANTLPRKVMCSTRSYFDISAKAVSVELDVLESGWLSGSAQCVKQGMYPASPRIILNTALNILSNQPHWTGVTRKRTFIRNSTIGNFTSMAFKLYVNVKANDKIVESSSRDGKKALCVTVDEATTISTTTQSPHRTSGNQGSTNDGPTVSVVVGVSFAVLVIVGGAVVIILLKRRGNLKCWMKTNVSRAECNLLPALDTASGIENHNQFILEKCRQSEQDIVIQSNASCSQNDEADYTTVEETEEPYARVEDENYDNTTSNTVTERKPNTLDNVYDKLKNSRSLHNDHEHGKLQVVFHNTVQDADNDYDVTSITLATNAKSSHVDDGDYNHIKPRTASTHEHGWQFV